ncbi:No apical meristem (NAM) protein [Musa troglodytarum]|uniref:No apical meristem (NAM) protein n=1 Tax=Musa troglodytarum TaxID=320322 RepID=A0A9E7GYG8_9LILI|nr:No apical meristem (NAM) protein [Musa troglodytarum]
MNWDPPVAPPPPPPPPPPAAPPPPPPSPRPPGIRFDPTGNELVQYFLRHKVLGLPFNEEAITEMDIYRFHPDHLTSKSSTPSSLLLLPPPPLFLGGISGPASVLESKLPVNLEGADGTFALFFMRRQTSEQRRRRRPTPRGYWNQVGLEKAVRDGSSSVIVGFKRKFVFYEGTNRTRWRMDEYRLNQEIQGLRNTIDPRRNNYVICKVYKVSSQSSGDLSFSSVEAQLIGSDESNSSTVDNKRKRN